MESRVGRTSHDYEVGLAVLREVFQLCSNLTAATGEVAANTCLAQFLGHDLPQSLVALGITDERDRRKEPAEGGRPGTWETKQAWTRPCSRTAKPTAIAKAR